MSRDQGLPSWQSTSLVSFEDAHADAARPYSCSRASTAILIQVPSVGPATRTRTTRQARRPSSSALEWARVHGTPRVKLAPRRRLRREIRLAGYALMMAAPLTLAALLLAGAPAADARSADGSAGPRSRITASIRPPAVFLSLEPAILLPATSTSSPESPVVLPGYLLPDDGFEEPAHAGG